MEKTDGVINSTRKFVWNGTEKCEFRNANDGVTVRVYSQGQHSGGTAYFYTRDHLGSIREMVDGTGNVMARYDYDSFGQSTTVIGTTKPDFNFTGLYRHAKSNLDLATYRAYDPDLGRWLNRDPAGEGGGLNFYGYVENNPLNAVDSLGLAPGDWWDPRTPFYHEREASQYAATLRGRMGNDSAHHGVAVREFARRMEESYDSQYVGLISAFLAIAYGNVGEFPLHGDYLQDMSAHEEGLWDYIYGTRLRCETL